jgi:iron-sulfur cluster insertion protein
MATRARSSSFPAPEPDVSTAGHPNRPPLHFNGAEFAENRKENTQVITLTDAATSKVDQLIQGEGEEGLALRVAVRPGGCSGFSYEMYFDSDIASDDQTVDYSGVRVVVDPSSAMLLEGATLDFKDGLEESGFSINNPNAERTCGCGQSFS